MGCGGSTAKETGGGESKSKSHTKYTEGEANSNTPISKDDEKGSSNKVVETQNDEKEKERERLEREKPREEEKQRVSGAAPPEAQPTEEREKEKEGEKSADATLDVGRSMSGGGGTLGKRLSQSTTTTGTITSVPAPEDEENDDGVLKSIQKLREQTILEARKIPLSEVKVAGVYLKSIAPSVELSPKDLQRIRRWADYVPPFDPIPAPQESTEAGRQPRENTLRVNQELLDTHERDKKHQREQKSHLAANLASPHKSRDTKSKDQHQSNMAEQADRSNNNDSPSDKEGSAHQKV